MQFPTMAEQAIERFKSSTKTISYSTIAKEMDAFRCEDEREFGKRVIVWQFDDESILRITGAGKSHKVEAQLP